MGKYFKEKAGCQDLYSSLRVDTSTDPRNLAPISWLPPEAHCSAALERHLENAPSHRSFPWLAPSVTRRAFPRIKPHVSALGSAGTMTDQEGMVRNGTSPSL